MDTALKLGDWAGFKKRRKEAKKRGKYRGIGVGNYVDISTGVPREKAEITVKPDNTVELVIGIVSQGQGHETSFAQLVNEWLGVPIECVRFVSGDTDRVTVGGGAHSGRGMRLGSIVIKKSSDGIIEKSMRIAEHLLETAAADIEFKNGRFAVKGTNHAVGIFEVARAAAERADLPEDLRGPLYASCDETVLDASYPYGSHVCEVEVDADTGKVTLINYVAVDDVGRAINPLIIHGPVSYTHLMISAPIIILCGDILLRPLPLRERKKLRHARGVVLAARMRASFASRHVKQHLLFVTIGHSRSKNGVALLAYDPVVHTEVQPRKPSGNSKTASPPHELPGRARQ